MYAVGYEGYFGITGTEDIYYLMDISFEIEAETVTLGEYDFELEEGDTRRVSFTAPEAGVYRFYTTGDDDTYGYLYDANGDLLYEDDDSDDGNFKLTKTMAAGETVLVDLRFYGYEEGTIHFVVDQPASEGDLNDDISWTVKNGVLTITGSGAITECDWGQAPWDDWKSAITTLSIGEGITSIGDATFYGYTALTTVSLPASLTNIGEEAFYNTAIASLSFAGTREQWAAVAIGERNVPLFAVACVCSDGESDHEDLNGYLGENVTWSFANGTLTISGTGAMDSDMAYDARYDFFNGLGASVRAVVVGDGVTGIVSYLFEDMSKLTSLSLPATLTLIGADIVYGCDSLKEITFRGTMEQWNAISCSPYALNNDMIIHCTDGDITYERPYVLYVEESEVYVGQEVWFYSYFYDEENYPAGVDRLIVSLRDANGELAGELEMGLEDDRAWSTETPGVYTVTVQPVDENGDPVEGVTFKPSEDTITVKEIPTSGTCGNGLTWAIDDTTLTITGSGAMDDYDWGDAPWYVSRSDIATVVIDAGVTSIGSYAFCNCYSLVSITIPESVTSIGSGAFDECSSLTSITIPDSVTSIGVWAF